MKIQKSPFQNHEPLFFKDFPAKNISFENASPKMGKFIDWDFTVTVLGGCKWCFVGRVGFTGGFMSGLRYYGLVCLLVDILWCGEFGFLYPVQINVQNAVCAGDFYTFAHLKRRLLHVLQIIL